MNDGAELKVVGKSGQISLGKRFAGKTLRVQHLPDGNIMLTAVAVVPESQLWTLEEPHRSRIQRGMVWAAKHPRRSSEPLALEKRALSGRRQGKRPR
jgi:hypothetical protein